METFKVKYKKYVKWGCFGKTCILEDTNKIFRK